MPKLTELIGEYGVIVHDNLLENLTDNHHLPVIARNHLENGQSKNLWYEQIVPRQARFYFGIIDLNEDEKVNDLFKETIKNGLVQIGANASVGYGFCKIEKKKI